MPLVLVIEDDPTTRLLHSRALSDLQGCTAVAVSSVAEARIMLASGQVDLLVLDLRLSDGTGLDVLQSVQASQPEAQVLVVSAFPQDLPNTGLDSARISVLRKPVAAADLRARVLDRLAMLSPATTFSLAEYVQMACLGQHSVTLVISDDEGSGRVTVHEGKVWAAHCQGLTGTEAFFALSTNSGRAVQVAPVRGAVGARNIQLPWEAILIEAARRIDEACRHTAEPDAPVSSSSGDSLAIEVDDLVARGVRAVVARDYHLAVGLLERARDLAPGNRVVRHRLERLYQLGYGHVPSD